MKCLWEREFFVNSMHYCETKLAQHLSKNLAPHFVKNLAQRHVVFIFVQ